MKVTPFSLKTRKCNVKIGEKLAFQSYTLIRTSVGNSLFPVGGRSLINFRKFVIFHEGVGGGRPPPHFHLIIS